MRDHDDDDEGNDDDDYDDNDDDYDNNDETTMIAMMTATMMLRGEVSLPLWTGRSPNLPVAQTISQ